MLTRLGEKGRKALVRIGGFALLGEITIGLRVVNALVVDGRQVS